MTVEDEVNHRIDRWLADAKFIFDELSYLKAKNNKVTKVKKAELSQQEKKRMSEAEKMLREVAVFVDDCYAKLKAIPNADAQTRAIADMLRAGSIFLSNPPESIPTLDYLFGMWHFFVYVNRAFSGNYHTYVSSIYEMELQEKTKELLFFHNGIATLGDLIDCIQLRRKLYDFTAARILECQNELLRLGYSIQPVTENSHYWSEVTAGTGLWICFIEGKSSYYIELNPQQEDALLKFACISRTPHGKVVAKLAI